MLFFVFKIFLSFFLGVLVGLEREWRKCAAGLRTNVLVSVGAAIFISMAVDIGGTGAERIASYVVSGVGFLGAGVILKDGASIRGLNTAATLWCTAAIGAYCGLGYILQPMVGTLFIISSHILLRPVSNRIRKISPFRVTDQEEFHYHFVALCNEADENHIRTLFIQYIGNNTDLMLKSISSTDTETPMYVKVDVEMISMKKQDRSMEKVASFLTLEKGIISIKWELDDSQMF